MKRYLGVFFGMAVFIMTIPCFSFIGGGHAPAKGFAFPSDHTGSDEKKSDPSETDVDSLQIFNHKTQKVETVTVSDYIKRVVAAEMPADYHTEALKAQAVAAHSYALNMKAQQETSPNKALKGADISTDPSTSQSYMDLAELKTFYGDKFESSYQKISDAVDAVIDRVIVYKGEPIAAAFHAISGGTTEDAANVWGRSLDYLKPVLSNGDLLSPGYEAKTELTADQVKTKLSAKFPGIQWTTGPNKWITITSTTASKTVKEANICGTVVSGSDLRAALGLHSAYFTVTYADHKFIFHTKGKGHGVGMSQYGADYLARQGKSYEEILKHYYSDVEITTLKK